MTTTNTKSCCPNDLPPVQSSYTPKGRLINIEIHSPDQPKTEKQVNFPAYETSNSDENGSKVVLICAYDIFGFHSNTKQVADRIAEITGFKVVMPDFFRGETIPIDGFPSPETNKLWQFVKFGWTLLSMPKVAYRNISMATGVKLEISSVINHYKNSEGVETFGFYGMCWGARPCIDSLCDFEQVKAGAIIHPSLWKTSDAEKIKKPLLLLPTKEENDMIPFYEILKRNVGEENCGHRRFDETFHGFFSARGDFTNDLNCKLVDEAIQLITTFFIKHLQTPQ